MKKSQLIYWLRRSGVWFALRIFHCLTFIWRKVFVYIYKTLRTTSVFCLYCLFLPFYRTYYFVKLRLSNFYTFLRAKVFHFLVRRHFIHGIAVLIAFIVVVNSLQAKDIRDENFGSQTVVIALFPYEEFDEHGEEEVEIQAQEIFELGSTTMGGIAVVKPQILQTETSQISDNKVKKYVVKSGETVSSIAKQFGISVDTILWQNNLRPTSKIKPGMTLEILSITGITHKVKWGETLGGIANKYAIDGKKILEANGLIDSMALRAGQIILIPGGKKSGYYTAPSAGTAAPLGSVTKLISGGKVIGTGTMLWPSVGRIITQYYSWRHHGLDIGLPKGQPIYAADDGIVLKSKCGWNGGYGCHVVIDHGNGIITLYAHASKLLVVLGDAVKRGDTIALVGSTGKSTGTHIHFEVRVNGKTVNPLGYVK